MEEDIGLTLGDRERCSILKKSKLAGLLSQEETTSCRDQEINGLNSETIT